MRINGMRYKRDRETFNGPLSMDWLIQWTAVPHNMRYRFTMNGTVGVDEAEPSSE